MVLALGRYLMITLTVIVVAGISVVVWPLEDNPERQLVAAGARLCHVNDETLLIGVILEGEQFDDTTVAVAAKVPTLQRLSLAESAVTRRGLESLRAATGLTSLNLNRTPNAGGTMDIVAGFGSLKELRLDGCEWLRDEHLAQLAPLTKLEILSLAETNVTVGSLFYLGQLPKLKFLVLDDCPNISDETIDALIEFSKPRRLSMSLSGTDITAEGLKRLRNGLPGITINLRPETLVGLRAIGERGQFTSNDRGEILGFRRRTEITGFIHPLQPGDLTIVGTVGSLVDLNLEGTNVDDSMLMELPQMSHLESLRLSGTQITDDGLKTLASFPNLQTLWILQDAIEGRGLTHLQQTPKLSNLKVQTQSGDEILRHVTQATELKSLWIDAPLTNAAISQLASLPRLHYLALIDTRIRAAGIERLATCPSLTELRMDNGLVDDSDIDAIASVRSLKAVALIQTSVTREGRDRLRQLRPGLTIQWTDGAWLGR